MLRDWNIEIYKQVAEERGFYDEAGAHDDADEPYESCGELVSRCSVCSTETFLGETREFVGNFGIEGGDPVCDECSFVFEKSLKHFIVPARHRASKVTNLLAEDAPVAKRSRVSKEAPASENEEVLLAILRELFPSETIRVNQFYDWLPSPLTREPMQLDMYLPDRNLAFEYDGAHHSMVVRGQRVTDLSKQYYRDIAKNGLCEKRGVRLIRINFNEPLTREYVEYKINKEVA